MENDTLHSIYTKEIKQRKNILEKVRNGIKISPNDRIWLMTHSLYNEQCGIDTFNVAVEQIAPKKSFFIKIKVESIFYDQRILPIISVPAQKGKIIADFATYDYSGKKTEKPVKMLGFEQNNNVDEYQIEYFSDLGLLSVEYQCDYFDKTTNLSKRESSSTGNPNFAMRRQPINDYTVRYCCKSPTDVSFDALIFTVQWKEK